MDNAPNLNIGMDDDGDYYIYKDERNAVPVEILDLIFELQKQNPEFFHHWMSMATSYIMVGNSVAEA